MKTLSIPFLRLVFGLAVAATAAGILGEIKVQAQPDGTPLWTNRYNGPGNGDDIAYAIAVDGNGNVIVTGSSYGLGTFDDYATIKYSSAGVPLWTNRHNGPENFYDTAFAVAVDGNGNVFVTGPSFSIDGDDYGTIKYSSAGVPLWMRRYGVPGFNTYDIPAAIAVDGSGNVIVTGSSQSIGGNGDYVTIKYSGAGVPLWTNRYNGNYNAYCSAIAVDGGGNVFVTGFDFDCVTIKYSNAGAPLWTNRYGASQSQTYTKGIAVDGGGNVFVTGFSHSNSPVSSDYMTIKYSNAGVPLWTNRYNGPTNSEDGSSAVAVDRDGNVFVTGYSTGSGTGYDYVTIKYSSAGGPLLTIVRTKTNTVAVSWPSPAADFTLQQNTNVAATNWTPVETTAVDDGTNKTVIVDPPEGNKFYRLFRP